MPRASRLLRVAAALFVAVALTGCASPPASVSKLDLHHVGGPSALDAWLAALGDDATHVDRRELTLNEAAPGDIRDTSTPKALAGDLESLGLGDVLEADDREVLTAWQASYDDALIAEATTIAIGALR